MKTTFKKIILDDLKAQGRKDIADKIYSVKYKSFSGGDSVDVYARNLTDAEYTFVENLLYQYQDGYFDSMQDMYVYDRENKKTRTAKYLFVRNEN